MFYPKNIFILIGLILLQTISVCAQDADGDGVMDTDDVAPNDPCSPYEFSAACDSDGDGVPNLYDDCSDTPAGSLVGVTGCEIETGCTLPEPDEDFSPEVVWISDVAIDARETTLVGDVTGDGIPEVIADDYNNTIIVFNGQTGETLYTIEIGAPFDFSNVLDRNGNPIAPLGQNNSANAIGDVDGDGYGEIFTLMSNQIWARCDFDGTDWNVTYAAAPEALAVARGYTPSLADFNGDGEVELYSGGQIWRTAFDGTANDLIATNGINYFDLGGSVAYDILEDNACIDCEGLELVAGGQVFSVNLDTGVITPVVQISATAFPQLINARATSVADMNQDGSIDIVFTNTFQGSQWLYVWDGQTPEVLLAYNTNDQFNNVARPNISDFDNDGYLEMGILYRIGAPQDAVPAVYEVIDDIVVGNGQPLWRINTSDRSGITGATVFDFDGDGASEVVYRDETTVRILDGRTGNTTFSAPCASGTRWEYPVVADVNADGNTNIICACADTGVTLFQSRDTPWRASRSVWNQHGYNITNVNDDLTIPRVPRSNTEGNGNAFNNFLQQSLADDDLDDRGLDFGNATFGEISFEGELQCPDAVRVSIEVINNGVNTLSGTMPITLYNADPRLEGALVLASVDLGQNLETGESVTLELDIEHPSAYDLNILLNVRDDEVLPLDFETLFPATGIAECDYNDNLASLPIVCPEVCYNGRDDDGDGLVDFDDPDCECSDIPLTIADSTSDICIGDPIPTFQANTTFVSPNGDVTIQWYDDVDAIPSNFIQQGNTFTPNENLNVGTYQFYVEAIEAYSGCTSERLPVTLVIHSFPELDEQEDVVACDSYALPELLVDNFYFTQANGGGNQLFPDELITQNTTVYILARSATNENCILEDTFDIEILPAPIIENWEEELKLCIDQEGNVDSITIGQDFGPEFQYDWTPDNDPDGDGVENPFLEINAIGEFRLTISPLNVEALCDPIDYVVNITEAAVPLEIQTPRRIDIFRVGEIQNIELNVLSNVDDSQDFEYSLTSPEGPFQDSAIFEDLESGVYTAYVRNSNGCGTTLSTNQFLILDYPTVFTPNGDGINETWNVGGLDAAVNSLFARGGTVSIFDRYGRFLADIQPNERGWNGTLNGLPLPSSDYWFSLTVESESAGSLNYKGHFSLKR